jgi:hypothetical protein
VGRRRAGGRHGVTGSCRVGERRRWGATAEMRPVSRTVARTCTPLS